MREIQSIALIGGNEVTHNNLLPREEEKQLFKLEDLS